MGHVVLKEFFVDRRESAEAEAGDELQDIVAATVAAMERVHVARRPEDLVVQLGDDRQRRCRPHPLDGGEEGGRWLVEVEEPAGITRHACGALVLTGPGVHRSFLWKEFERARDIAIHANRECDAQACVELVDLAVGVDSRVRLRHT